MGHATRSSRTWLPTDRPGSDDINVCIHCGLCLSVCPTYCETSIEPSSPRGRIFLMRAVEEGRTGLDSAVFQEQMGQCLNCRACEAVCPSGVPYGRMLEASRAQIEQARTPVAASLSPPALPPRPGWQRAVRHVVFDNLFAHTNHFTAFSAVLALYQRSGVQWLARTSNLLCLLHLDEMERMLPPMSRAFLVPQGQRYRAEGEPRMVVALFAGCIMRTAFAHVHAATIRVLQKNGCDVLIPPPPGVLWCPAHPQRRPGRGAQAGAADDSCL